MRRFFFVISVSLFSLFCKTYSQVSITSTGADPHPSSMLEVSATDKGLLVPRVSLTQTTSPSPITNPAVSLLVYNTATINDVTPGYYYWNGSQWVRIATGSGAGTSEWEDAGTYKRVANPTNDNVRAYENPANGGFYASSTTGYAFQGFNTNLANVTIEGRMGAPGVAVLGRTSNPATGTTGALYAVIGESVGAGAGTNQNYGIKGYAADGDVNIAILGTNLTSNPTMPGGDYAGVFNWRIHICDDNSTTQYPTIEFEDGGILRGIRLNSTNLQYQDATGTWQDFGGGSGDNLGNHTATMALNMNTYNINSVGDITPYNNSRYLGSSTYPWGRFYITGPIYANGATGSAGQVLTSNGTGSVYWSTVSGGSLPAGSANQTLRHDGTNWVANSTLLNNGSVVAIGGAINTGYRLYVYGGGGTYSVYGYYDSNNGAGLGVGTGYGVNATCNGSGGRGIQGTVSSSSSTAGVYGLGTGSAVGVYFSNGLSGSGTKSAVVKSSKGPVKVYCQESPENWFEDFGSCKIYDGKAIIEIRKDFLEIITIDENNPYKVFITPSSDAGEKIWVEKMNDKFIIHAPFASDGVEFDYRIVAKRKGYENLRLTPEKWAYSDPNLYEYINEIPQEYRLRWVEANIMLGKYNESWKGYLNNEQLKDLDAFLNAHIHKIKK